MVCGIINEMRWLFPWLDRWAWAGIQKPHHQHSEQSVKAEDCLSPAGTYHNQTQGKKIWQPTEVSNLWIVQFNDLPSSHHIKNSTLTSASKILLQEREHSFHFHYPPACSKEVPWSWIRTHRNLASAISACSKIFNM